MTTLDLWNDAGPLTRDALDDTIRAVQERLDLLAVLRERYGMQVDDAGDRWRTECFLPSLVSGFVGSCAEQDATTGERPRNLWISDGDTTRVWRCHSCKRHGDVIDLIEHADDLLRSGQAVSLRAVRAAAKLAGVTYLMDDRPQTEADEPDPLMCVEAPAFPRPKQHTAAVSFDRVRNINAAVVGHWRQQLTLSDKARRELARRNVTDEQIERYLIGYAPDEWRDLVGKLSASWRDDAATLGLIGRNRLGNLYDRQRDRIMFPYCEPARDGRPAAVTGFAGRTLADDDPRAPKWLNSSNVNAVWSKSSALLGLYQAQERTRLLGHATITEGIYDTLAFDRIDKPATALVSAALTLQHCAVVVDVLGAKQLTIAFDGDDTGRREALAAATTALQAGFAYEDVTLIDPGNGNDPDDLAPSDLDDRWHTPLSIVEFALMFGSLASQTHKLTLLSTLNGHGEQLLHAWGIDANAITKHQARGSAATPTSRLAAALLQAPEHAQHLAAIEADRLFATDTLAARKLVGLSFGEHTDLAALPIGLRCEWLACRAQHLTECIAAHDVSDPFAFAPEDSFRAWFDHGEVLRREAKSVRDRLDEARAHG